MLNVPLLIAVTAAALFSVAAAAQGIYRWVDENGATHYSATPPPPGQAREVRELPRSAPASGSASGSVAAPSTWQDKELEFRRRRLETETENKKEEERLAAEQRKAGERREACVAARHDLEALQGGRPVYSLDERGERVYFDDTQRATAIEAAKRDIREYCP